MCEKVNIQNQNQPKQVKKVRLPYHGPQQVRTDGTIPNNKPDIIIHDKKEGICMLIDVTVSGDRNVIKKEAEKI